jgi:hypothetical protein
MMLILCAKKRNDGALELQRQSYTLDHKHTVDSGLEKVRAEM